MRSRLLSSLASCFLCLAVLALLSACSREASSGSGGSASAGGSSKSQGPALRKIRFQTDWFPQGEHGGFYQALAKGFYREVGLDVEILPGGPGAHIKPKVVSGDADFGMNPATDIVVAASRGLPLYMVGAFLQHDHEALLLHADSPVRGFADLAGRSLIVHPSLAWVQYLKNKYKISFTIQPVPYGLARFLSDPDAIQAGVVTNEPWQALQAGKRVRLLPLTDAGYDTYHVIFCRRDFAEREPAVVRAFVRASLKGWEDYLLHDPAPAHGLILARNSSMSESFLQYSRAELLLRRIVDGDPARGEYLGRFSAVRISEIIRMLYDLKVIDMPVSPSSVATTEFSP